MKILGTTGPAGSGKDETSDLISGLRDVTKCSLADPIKRMLMTLGLTEDQLWGAAKDIVDLRFGCTPRHMMQTLGTEWGRNLIHPDIWVNQLLELAEESQRDIIISDIRFGNEADVVRANGTLLHIEGRDGDGGVGQAHVSEAGVAFQAGDLVVDNSGALEDLRPEVMQTLIHLNALEKKS